MIVVAGGKMPRPHPVVRLVPEQAGIAGDEEADDGQRRDEEQDAARVDLPPQPLGHSVGGGEA